MPGYVPALSYGLKTAYRVLFLLLAFIFVGTWNIMTTMAMVGMLLFTEHNCRRRSPENKIVFLAYSYNIQMFYYDE